MPLCTRFTPLAAAFALAAGEACATAGADIVHVRVDGSVENNAFTSGALAGIPSGATVVLEFDVDSEVFTDSVNVPTRGYPIVGDTLTFTAGAVTVTRNMAYPAYFCLRNNDPRADGFFLSQGYEVDTQIPLNLGLASAFGVAFSRTFAIDPPFPTPDDSLTSLDILDAFGSWGYEDISSYNFTIEINQSITPMIIEYTRLTISGEGCAGGLCPADFNCSGAVTVQDIYDFLADWSSQSSGGPIIVNSADFNGAGGVTVQDIYDYLAAWSVGCQ